MKDNQADSDAMAEDLESARAANRRKDEFLAMLGHELRDPLAPIITALQLMRVSGAATAYGQELEVIERQVRFIASLVDDLLDVSRISRGKVHLRKRHLELGEVTRRALELTSALISQRNHELNVRV